MGCGIISFFAIFLGGGSDLVVLPNCSDDLYAEIKKMLASSSISDSEDFAPHDYEGFGDVHISEYASLATIVTIAECIAEDGELGAGVLAHVNGDIEEAQRLLDECYHGEHNSEEDFAESFSEDTMTIPEHFTYYIDYKKWREIGLSTISFQSR